MVMVEPRVLGSAAADRLGPSEHGTVLVVASAGLAHAHDTRSTRITDGVSALVLSCALATENLLVLAIPFWSLERRLAGEARNSKSGSRKRTSTD